MPTEPNRRATIAKNANITKSNINSYKSKRNELKLDGIKQAPANIFKIDDLPKFQIQVAKGQVYKPLATTTLKFDIGDHTFAEHFGIMKKVTGSIIGWYLMNTTM